MMCNLVDITIFSTISVFCSFRKNRLSTLKEKENIDYVDLDKIREEIESSKKIFKKNQWPTIDVTRKSVEETAASIIKIYEIKNKKNA